MSQFTKTANGAVLFQDNAGQIYGFQPNCFVHPHPRDARMIMLSDDANPQETDKAFSFGWEQVTAPAGSASRNELISTLTTAYFYASVSASVTLDKSGLATDANQTAALAALALLAKETKQDALLDLFNAVKLDTFFRNLTIWEAMNRLGKAFIATEFISNLANNAAYNIGITTGEKESHAAFSLAMEGEAEFYLYENSTFTGGNTVLNTCRNRTINGTHATTFVSVPAVTVIGSPLAKARSGMSSNVSGQARDVIEWHLKANTKYILQIINRSSQSNKTVNFECEYWEE